MLCTCTLTSYLSVVFDHNVAVVSVSYPEDKCSYTVASTGPCKQIDSQVVPAQIHTGQYRVIPDPLNELINESIASQSE